MTQPYANSDEHRQVTSLVARGCVSADQALARLHRQEPSDRTRCEVDYLRAELRHWRCLYGRQSATIGEQRGTIARLRAEVRDHLAEAERARAAAVVLRKQRDAGRSEARQEVSA